MERKRMAMVAVGAAVVFTGGGLVAANAALASGSPGPSPQQVQTHDSGYLGWCGACGRWWGGTGQPAPSSTGSPAAGATSAPMTGATPGMHGYGQPGSSGHGQQYRSTGGWHNCR